MLCYVQVLQAPYLLEVRLCTSATLTRTCCAMSGWKGSGTTSACYAHSYAYVIPLSGANVYYLDL
jgi:hypothetical protein